MATWATKTQDRAHSPMGSGVTTSYGNMTRPQNNRYNHNTETLQQPPPNQENSPSISQESEIDTLNHHLFDSRQGNNSIQVSLQKIKENHPFGDLISSPKIPGTCRIFFQMSTVSINTRIGIP
jgi:hypothetical protein